MKIIEVPLEDGFYDNLVAWFVREGRDLSKWARTTLGLHAPVGNSFNDPVKEAARQEWETRMDAALAAGLYGDLERAFRKHGLEMAAFYQNGLRVEDSRAAYALLINRPDVASPSEVIS